MSEPKPELDFNNLDEEQLRHFLRDLFLAMIEERGVAFAYRMAGYCSQYVLDIRKEME